MISVRLCSNKENVSGKNDLWDTKYQMDLESKQEHVAVEDWDALEFSLKTTKASLLTSHQHEMKQTPPQITNKQLNKEVYKGKLEMQGIYKLLTKADI